MTTTMFLILLSGFSVVSSLVTEGIKNISADKVNLSYNIVALIIAMIVGGGGTAIYYQLNTIPFTVNNVIYLVLMGFASALVSMTSYDKVKQTIEQFVNKNKG